MQRDRLDRRLQEAFDGSDDQRRVVVRAAVDLADVGRFADTHGVELDVDTIVRNLREAPADLGLVERWNWWIGALELAHGGFEPFRVRRYRDA